MTTSRKVVITDWGFTSLGPEKQVFAGHDIEMSPHQCKTEDDVAAAVADADIVMTQWAPVKAKAIAAMTKCRGIVRYGIGLDNLDLAAAAARNIRVRNVPDYCLYEVADHTMALILALNRQVCRVNDLVRSGTWKIVPPLPLPPLRQSTLGLIGFGRIARLVAARANAFGMRVIAADAYADPDAFGANNAYQVELDELISEADVISLQCPLTDETRYVVNEKSLASMKPTALIVNTSRGGLIDTGALIAALKNNTIAGAALDVLEQEPPDFGSELFRLPNAITTSHNAWYSNASVGELQRLAAEAALELLRE